MTKESLFKRSVEQGLFVKLPEDAEGRLIEMAEILSCRFGAPLPAVLHQLGEAYRVGFEAGFGEGRVEGLSIQFKEDSNGS